MIKWDKIDEGIQNEWDSSKREKSKYQKEEGEAKRFNNQKSYLFKRLRDKHCGL